MNYRTNRRLRWLVPGAVLTMVAGVGAVARALPADAGVPNLAPLTPAQLLDKVRTAHVDGLSGDIQLTTHLGLPDLSSLGVRSGSLLDLLTGSHTSHLSIDGADHVRLALDAPQSESDWIRNGTDLWSWDSTTQAVNHTTVHTDGDSDRSTEPTRPATDPIAATNNLLAALDPTTAVSVTTPAYVAGRPVYALVLAPRSAASTVGDVVVSVDSATGVPLAVRIDARGTSTPAVELRFTAVSFNRPAASTFAFTPPPGATVTEVRDATKLLPLGRTGPRHKRRLPPGPSADRATRVTPKFAPAPAPSAMQAKVVGTGWESVAIINGLGLGRQFQTLFANAPSVSVGTQHAHLLTTSLVNVLIFDDGHLALGAVTPQALEAAVSAP